MKHQNSIVSICLKACALAALLSAPYLQAADPPASGNTTYVPEVAKRIEDAWALYQTLELKPDTSIPDWVVAKAKGVIIFNLSWGGAGIGASSGTGIGMKKNKDNTFSAPAFYTLGGINLGPQLGGGNARVFAFLMSDSAVNTLTDSKMLWAGNARAVAGSGMAKTSTMDDSSDVIFYQVISGLDVGTAFGATKLSVDNDSNRSFYNKADITPADIFEGKVSMPDAINTLVVALNKQASIGSK